MKIYFRVDASIQIGSGHIMRCLTLADELRSVGEDVHFICRDLEGHMADTIHNRGMKVTLLPRPQSVYVPKNEEPTHAPWLVESWKKDVEDTIKVISNEKADWVIVDHYGIDYRWHCMIKPYIKKIMVIDDLADRKLECDLLFDQTHGREDTAYRMHVPNYCHLVLGIDHALIRTEFKKLRQQAFSKRENCSDVKHILVFMGGTDPENITGQILDSFSKQHWKNNTIVNVVLGGNAPYLNKVKEQACNLQLQINVFSDVTNMAELMLWADYAIGAGGVASLERCYMGLPSTIVVTADNQQLLAKNLEKAGVANLANIGDFSDIGRLMSSYNAEYKKMVENCKDLFREHQSIVNFIKKH